MTEEEEIALLVKGVCPCVLCLEDLSARAGIAVTSSDFECDSDGYHKIWKPISENGKTFKEWTLNFLTQQALLER